MDRYPVNPGWLTFTVAVYGLFAGFSLVLLF